MAKHVHIITEAEARQKIKGYINVFWGLVALTIIELAIVYGEHVGIPHLAVMWGVIIFSCAKAVVVGYYYMHLNHETKWLKIVACVPVIAAVYAAVLVLEARVAQVPSEYEPHYPRVFKRENPHAATPAEPATPPADSAH